MTTESYGAEAAMTSLRPKQNRHPASGAPSATAGAARFAAIDFPSYILSYYTQGLVLLGEVPNPYTNKKEEDPEGARHTVDILSMLQEKTKGNLARTRSSCSTVCSTSCG